MESQKAHKAREGGLSPTVISPSLPGFVFPGLTRSSKKILTATRITFSSRILHNRENYSSEASIRNGCATATWKVSSEIRYRKADLYERVSKCGAGVTGVHYNDNKSPHMFLTLHTNFRRELSLGSRRFPEDTTAVLLFAQRTVFPGAV